MLLIMRLQADCRVLQGLKVDKIDEFRYLRVKKEIAGWNSACYLCLQGLRNGLQGLKVDKIDEI